MKRSVFFLTLLLLVAGGNPRAARAEWEILPESRQHLYQTYANFVDQQNMLGWRDSNEYWATVSGALPVAGDNDSPYHPQFILHFSGNDAMNVAVGGGVFTETLDTRLGLDFQFALPQWWAYGLRFSIGIQHESGHTVDGTDDPTLAEDDLGDNTYRFQVFRDFMEQIRAGILIAPVINSIPDNYPAQITFMADYFPLGASEEQHSFKPFISSSLEHKISFSDGQFTFQAQAGVALGSHFHERHTHDMRVAIGYYEGSDPRAKYAQYEFLRTQFGFLCLMFNL